MSVVTALALGFIPTLIWLIFFLKEDNHPEPRSLILKTFILGGFSAFFALFLEILLKNPLEKIIFTLPRLVEENLSVFLVFGIVEELVKFLFVYLLVRRNTYFDEPIDAMVYMVTGALGFATTENLLLVFSNNPDSVFSTILFRFIGANLLHALSSAIVGHYWARGIRFNLEGKFVFAGLLLASIFHVIFNYLVFKFSDFLIYPIAFLIILGFFVLYDFEELKKVSEGIF